MTLDELIKSLKGIKKSYPGSADFEVRISGMYGAQTKTIDDIEVVSGTAIDDAYINFNTDLMTG